VSRVDTEFARNQAHGALTEVSLFLVGRVGIDRPEFPGSREELRRLLDEIEPMLGESRVDLLPIKGEVDLWAGTVDDPIVWIAPRSDGNLKLVSVCAPCEIEVVLAKDGQLDEHREFVDASRTPAEHRPKHLGPQQAESREDEPEYHEPRDFEPGRLVRVVHGPTSDLYSGIVLAAELYEEGVVVTVLSRVRTHDLEPPQLSDDRGTEYRMMGGAGLGHQRVSRFCWEFVPPVPMAAAELNVTLPSGSVQIRLR
jgi:hypothetical protein